LDRVEVFDDAGESLVRTSLNENQEGQIDFRNYDAGIYILNIRCKVVLYLYRR